MEFRLINNRISLKNINPTKEYKLKNFQYIWIVIFKSMDKRNYRKSNELSLREHCSIIITSKCHFVTKIEILIIANNYMIIKTLISKSNNTIIFIISKFSDNKI